MRVFRLQLIDGGGNTFVECSAIRFLALWVTSSEQSAGVADAITDRSVRRAPDTSEAEIKSQQSVLNVQQSTIRSAFAYATKVHSDTGTRDGSGRYVYVHIERPRGEEERVPLRLRADVRERFDVEEFPWWHRMIGSASVETIGDADALPMGMPQSLIEDERRIRASDPAGQQETSSTTDYDW
ncbi:hypothetical protein EVG20_g2916 [Dentipellis fragilis]|uniref:Uncharacterized protein n=1 Tax=Dentipellis fragilis TaxID=205917 RepID=A0A4Y9Z7L8_9AGAM|nr:hypothetical protein EVG20_g2916 [Dentipellis fragilis]